MTVAPHPGSGLDSWNQEDFGDIGLEDVGTNELTIPRMEIVHDKGAFRDRNSKVEYPLITAILLGVVKGRIFWAKEVDDNDQPLCRSNDFETGFPQTRKDLPADKQFPWSRSNFSEADFPPEQDGSVRLPCSSCRFKEWDSNGFGQKKPPCSELYHIPMLYQSDAEGTLTPAILSLKSSAVKNIRSYITPFKSARRPLFTAWTEMTLQLSSRGAVKYSVPNFRKLGDTDRDVWMDAADQYRSIREFLQRAPRPQEPKKPGASSMSATALDPNDPWNAPPPGGQPDWPTSTPPSTAPPQVVTPASRSVPPRPAPPAPASDLPF